MEMTETHEIIKDIKSKFRLFMNGKVSQSMRERGLGYKLNFGIEYPRIKEIAQGYSPSHQLAQALWKEDIRECKIMAGMLQPADSFCMEIAEIWIESMSYPELAEYTVMNLFQRLPYVHEAAFKWMADDREYFLLCGFLLMARLLMQGKTLNERAAAEFLDQAMASIDSEYPAVRNAVETALRKYAGLSENNRKQVKAELQKLAKAGNARHEDLLDGVECSVE